MFGCQQVLIKTDRDTQAIISYFCFEYNNLYNCTVYYARQMWFKTGKIVNGFDLTAQMKINRHFNAGYASSMQQNCINVGEAFKSFKQLLSKNKKGELGQKPKPPKYRKTGGLFTVTYPKRWLKLSEGQIRFLLGNQVKSWFGISEFFCRCQPILNGKQLKKYVFYPETIRFMQSLSTRLSKKSQH